MMPNRMETLLPKSTVEPITLNNQGAAMLETGNYAKALSIFGLALQNAKAAMKSNGGETTGSAGTGGYTLDDFMSKESVPLSSSQDNCHSKAFFYRHPMKVPTYLEGKSSQGLHTHICVCIVFNLALSHHQAALEYNNQEKGSDQTNGRLLLRKAIKFYQSLFSIVDQEECCQHGRAFFALVVLNNLGHTHEALNEVEEADCCFRHLLTTLMCLYDNDRSLREIGPDKLECFFLSTSHLILSVGPAEVA